MKNIKENVNYTITQGAMALIESVVNRTGITDPQDLVPEVCEELINRYGSNPGKGDKKLSYHLAQMHLTTTKEVRRAIECFFISKQLFPKVSYCSPKKAA